MPSGEFQLIAMGPQDYYLTGNPSITFLNQSIEGTQIFQWR